MVGTLFLFGALWLLRCGGGVVVAFSGELVVYLRSLPAVAGASSTRIVYADWFRRDCVRRYRAGEHPVDLFREAGLDPKLIGYKRIERAFARWRAEARVPALPAGRPRKASRDPVDVTDGVISGTDSAGGGDAVIRSDAEVAAVPSDPRDLLIEQQIHYIHYLEERLRRAETSG